MMHPFALTIADLACLEELNQTESEVTGAKHAITLAIHEGGTRPPISRGFQEIGATTHAIGEEGGHPPITSKARHEEGGAITQSCAETGCDVIATH
jgi:hypothetical protein